MQTKPDDYYNQSAVIPYRVRQGKIEVLLVTSIKRKRWILPKGIIENDLSAGQSAAKEAFEEAGVSGQVRAKPMGMYKIKKWGASCRVIVYPMKVETVHEVWPENNMRRRKWFGLSKSKLKVHRKNIVRLISKLPEIVENNK